MMVYVDTSVVLRRLLKQANAINNWSDWTTIYSSVLMRVEAFRTLDRVRLEKLIDDPQRTLLHQELQKLTECISLVQLSDSILERASQPMPTSLGTLDALHLTTALAVQQQEQVSLTLVTHDERLAQAGQAMGLTVAGI